MDPTCAFLVGDSQWTLETEQRKRSYVPSQLRGANGAIRRANDRVLTRGGPRDGRIASSSSRRNCRSALRLAGRRRRGTDRGRPIVSVGQGRRTGRCPCLRTRRQKSQRKPSLHLHCGWLTSVREREPEPAMMRGEVRISFSRVDGGIDRGSRTSTP